MKKAEAIKKEKMREKKPYKKRKEILKIKRKIYHNNKRCLIIQACINRPQFNVVVDSCDL